MSNVRLRMSAIVSASRASMPNLARSGLKEMRVQSSLGPHAPRMGGSMTVMLAWKV